MPPVISEKVCVGCGKCADICPLSVFTFDKTTKKAPEVTYPEECWHCNACVLDCPRQAIRLRVPLNYLLLHVDADQFTKA